MPVVKSDGSVRLCGDYKVTMNPQLQVAQYPLPKLDDMFVALGGCQIFSKIDLKQAFQQLVMDDAFQEVCTINTHLELYKPKRVPYGIASSPAVWQQSMDTIFSWLQGVFCFVDDMLIAGKEEVEHRERLQSVLELIKQHGLKIRKDKCQLAVATVEYLGFRLDGQGIHTTDEKVKAMKGVKEPENKSELQSFLGLVTFCAKFIPNLATIHCINS